MRRELSDETNNTIKRRKVRKYILRRRPLQDATTTEIPSDPAANITDIQKPKIRRRIVVVRQKKKTDRPFFETARTDNISTSQKEVLTSKHVTASEKIQVEPNTSMFQKHPRERKRKRKRKGKGKTLHTEVPATTDLPVLETISSISVERLVRTKTYTFVVDRVHGSSHEAVQSSTLLRELTETVTHTISIVKTINPTSTSFYSTYSDA